MMSKSIKYLVRQKSICLWKVNANRIAVNKFEKCWLMNSDTMGIEIVLNNWNNCGKTREMLARQPERLSQWERDKHGVKKKST